MKDTRQVASEVMSKLPATLKGEIVTWSAAIDEAVYNCMKEYAKEVLQDYDNWKAHNTPNLVKQYINEKGL